MKLSEEEFINILFTWKSGLKVFSPFFKHTQFVSLSHTSNNQVKKVDINDSISKEFLTILKDVDFSTTLLMIDHEDPLMVSLILNNIFNIKPVLLMNNYVFHSHSLIDNNSYLNKLYNVSKSLNHNDNPAGYAFITNSKRFKLYHGNADFSDVFLNEYEIADYDLPSIDLLKKYTKYTDLLYIGDNEFIKDDMDAHLHYFEKYLSVKRHITSPIN
jgi:hypothetical protein